ncbi:MAG TPA: SDR family NAD(P)-dependent oxidoreductase [Candidatus Dormibacteraeota bacterium]|nr:SDR family NAD(P)-dependent oxidoreductase [Candidatus Dormibacteraeota bacterium]
MNLEGSAAVITGGASGIGRACALAMARRGSDVIIADINEQRMDDTVSEIQALGRRSAGLRCDVSRDGELELLAERAIAEMGRIDVLMNNAGVVLGGPVEQIAMADWEWIVNINLLGPVRGVRAFLPHMLERGSGYIVNTASFAGLVAHNPLTIPYDTTKHGVVGFSAGLALYCRPRGIGVSVLCPGYVETNLSENYRFRGLDDSSTVPGRMPDVTVQPEAVAERVVEAVEAERFLILSQPEHALIWARRAQDIDAHIQRQIEVLTAARPAPAG